MYFGRIRNKISFFAVKYTYIKKNYFPVESICNILNISNSTMPKYITTKKETFGLRISEFRRVSKEKSA
ncbi:hypothetical protein C4Q31_12610 [Leptospira borgpetersenii serovar Ceylonica]|nr:hypothetical protein C4Q31_12610 [Leptospira borgpetersenii serovar Ceylonica]